MAKHRDEKMGGASCIISTHNFLDLHNKNFMPINSMLFINMPLEYGCVKVEIMETISNL